METRRQVLAAAAWGMLAAGCARGSSGGDDAQVIAYPYGEAAAQVADLHLPAERRGAPVVVLVHGGFWAAGYDRSLARELAADLVSAGYAVWNLDYRAVGAGGGWPTTLQDVASGCDALVPAATEHGLALADVAVVGHSAGGQLALWAAGRHRLRPGSPGAGPRLRPALAVSQAGVNDLVSAHALGLGGDAVAAFLDVPAGIDLRTHPARRHLIASPVELVPLGVPTLVVTGDADDRVPVSQSTGYAARARAAGDEVSLEVVSGEGHFEHLEVGSQVWARTRSWLDGRLHPG